MAQTRHSAEEAAAQERSLVEAGGVSNSIRPRAAGTGEYSSYGTVTTRAGPVPVLVAEQGAKSPNLFGEYLGSKYSQLLVNLLEIFFPLLDLQKDLNIGKGYVDTVCPNTVWISG